MGLPLAMTLIFEFSRSYMILTIWWPRSGVRIYQIVTGVTSVVGVPSTHLVVVCYLKEICGISQAEDWVTWPDLLHRHRSTLTSFRVAPNSGPTLKSLLAPEFWLVLDLVVVHARMMTYNWVSSGYPDRNSVYHQLIYFHAPNLLRIVLVGDQCCWVIYQILSDKKIWNTDPVLSNIARSYIAGILHEIETAPRGLP